MDFYVWSCSPPFTDESFGLICIPIIVRYIITTPPATNRTRTPEPRSAQKRIFCTSHEFFRSTKISLYISS